MTGLRRMRKMGKSLVVISLIWEVAATIVCLLLLAIVIIQDGVAPFSERLITLAGTIGLIGVVAGAIWQARRRKGRQTPEPIVDAGKKV